jgi:transposase
MFQLGSAIKIFLAPGPTDLRKSFDTLSALVRDQLAQDPLSGHVFAFCNRRRDRLKILFFDGTGLWVCTKRIEGGSYHWPGAGEPGPIRLNQQQMALLVGGIDLAKTTERRWWRPQDKT